jgi:hypothetical protein
MPEQYAAGGTIVSYCTKCKLNLDHSIVAMVGEAVGKVNCKTCGSTHKFRDPSAPKPRTARAKAADALTPSRTVNWEAGIAGAKGRERAYSMAGKYRVGEVIVHDRFGKGIVLKLYMNKCDVLFQDKERLMASAN